MRAPRRALCTVYCWHPQGGRAAEANGLLKVNIQFLHFTDEEPRAEKQLSPASQLSFSSVSRALFSELLIFLPIYRNMYIHAKMVACTEKYENKERNRPIISLCGDTLSGALPGLLPSSPQLLPNSRLPTVFGPFRALLLPT